MTDHTNLLGDDIELFAHFHADLDQHDAVMRADAFRFGEFVTDHFARQRRVQRLAPGLFAFVRAHLRVGLGLLCGQCRRRGRQRFGLVQKQVALIGATGLALGAEQPSLECF